MQDAKIEPSGVNLERPMPSSGLRMADDDDDDEKDSSYSRRKQEQ